MNPATKFFAELQTGHVDQALALTAAGFTWTVPGAPGGAFGLSGVYSAEQFPAMLSRAAAALPEGPRTEITTVVETPRHVVIEARVRGRAANGGEYDNRVAYVFELDGDKITAVREYLDTVHAAEIFTA